MQFPGYSRIILIKRVTIGNLEVEVNASYLIEGGRQEDIETKPWGNTRWGYSYGRENGNNIGFNQDLDPEHGIDGRTYMQNHPNGPNKESLTLTKGIYHLAGSNDHTSACNGMDPLNSVEYQGDWNATPKELRPTHQRIVDRNTMDQLMNQAVTIAKAEGKDYSHFAKYVVPVQVGKVVDSKKIQQSEKCGWKKGTFENPTFFEELIMAQEGFNEIPKAEGDKKRSGSAIYTVGYGITGWNGKSITSGFRLENVYEGVTDRREAAYKMMQEMVARKDGIAREIFGTGYTKAPMNVQMAILDFTYNMREGSIGMGKGEIVDVAKQHDYPGLMDKLRQYHKSKGHSREEGVKEGLMNRRITDIYLTAGDYKSTYEHVKGHYKGFKNGPTEDYTLLMAASKDSGHKLDAKTLLANGDLPENFGREVNPAETSLATATKITKKVPLGAEPTGDSRLFYGELRQALSRNFPQLAELTHEEAATKMARLSENRFSIRTGDSKKGGSYRENIALAQAVMIQNGEMAMIPADDFGHNVGGKTSSAVKRKQREEHLQIDGVIGRQTWAQFAVDVGGPEFAVVPGRVINDGDLSVEQVKRNLAGRKDVSRLNRDLITNPPSLGKIFEDPQYNNYIINSPFGPRNTVGSPMHYSIDIKGKGGVLASADGVVLQATSRSKSYTKIYYPDLGLVAGYVHMDAAGLKSGDIVEKGQRIGEVSTGYNHLDLFTQDPRSAVALNAELFIPDEMIAGYGESSCSLAEHKDCTTVESRSHKYIAYDGIDSRHFQGRGKNRETFKDRKPDFLTYEALNEKIGERIIGANWHEHRENEQDIRRADADKDSGIDDNKVSQIPDNVKAKADKAVAEAKSGTKPGSPAPLDPSKDISKLAAEQALA